MRRLYPPRWTTEPRPLKEVGRELASVGVETSWLGRVYRKIVPNGVNGIRQKGVVLESLRSRERREGSLPWSAFGDVHVGCSVVEVPAKSEYLGFHHVDGFPAFMPMVRLKCLKHRRVSKTVMK